jgi:Phage tail tube protein, GTA-gp10
MDARMSRIARITEQFGGDERDFLMAWGELIELQEARDAGPSWVLQRLVSGQWLMQDISDIIRLGLIGGGMLPSAAKKLTQQFVEQRPQDIAGVDGILILAIKILSAALYGAPDEVVGKTQGETRNGSTISPEEKSDTAPSSAMQ